MILYCGGNKNKRYIIDKDNNEAYVFESSFGESIGKISAIKAMSDCMNARIIEVDVVSFVGETNSMFTNVYFNGYCTDVDLSILNTVKSVRKNVKPLSDSTVYKIKHDNMLCNHLLLVYKKGTLSKDKLSCILQAKNPWVKCN